MSRATAPIRDLAARLIACETKGSKGSDLAFPVIERLRLYLTTLMGHGGFRALLARAHALASEEVPWLRSLQIKDDGSVAELDERAGKVGSRDLLEGSVELTAQLLGLLVAFIGENLAMRLVREIWPKLPLENLPVGKGAKK